VNLPPEIPLNAPFATIVPYRDGDAAAFYALNRVWLDEHGLYEEPDELQLADTVGQILEPGGAIWVAVSDGVVVGTAAVVPHAPGEVEIVKLTVAGPARGQGLGRRLAERCIEEAKAMGAQRIVLVSSSRLGAALRLYEALGFHHVPPPRDPVYSTADVYLPLDLAPRHG
jgi:ribosomal protein S18 acetylase RimI-like enzyme